MQPNVSRQTDVVACGSTIGNLLRFLEGEDKPFRMLVELVGETTVVTRRENTPQELIPNVQGYGHSFPEAYTTWEPEVKGSTSHQRVLSYRFGGLGFLLRFEGDGYIVDEDGGRADAPSASSRTDNLDVAAELDVLSDELTGSGVRSKLPEKTDTGLKVLCAGKLVQQDPMFDLKTRSVRKKEAETFDVTLGDQLKRLWIAQIPSFLLAYHVRGVFEEIHVKNVRDAVHDWESTHVDLLSRLAALLHHIIGHVRAKSDHKVELRHDAVGVLEIREQLAGAGDAVSEAVKRLWEDGQAGASCETSPGDAALADDAASEGSSTRDWDDEFEPDYTACSAEDCGYCGRCSY